MYRGQYSKSSKDIFVVCVGMYTPKYIILLIAGVLLWESDQGDTVEGSFPMLQPTE